MNATPLKVLHVVHSLEPGGLENGIVNLSNALDPSAFETHVFCLEKAGKFSERLRDPKKLVAYGKGPGFAAGAVVSLNRHIRSLRPEVIHTHNLGPLIYGSLASICGRWRPVLQGEHSQLTEEEMKPRRMKQRRWLYKTCAKIHTVSDSLQKHLVDLGFPAAKIVSIPNGVDSDRFSPAAAGREDARQRLGIAANARVIGIVGRFGPFKRHAVLVEAFSQMSEKFADAHLLIVGSGGPNGESVRAQIAASSCASRMHIFGFQDRPEDYYRCMDLLVVPSINEGLSNAVLEAMACEVPVLSHASCGSTEAITHGEDGFIADLGDAGLLRGELEKLLAQPELLSDLGRKAREKIVRRFSLRSMKEGYSKLYLEVAGRLNKASQSNLLHEELVA